VPAELLASGELQRIDALIDEKDFVSNYETDAVGKDGRRITVALSCANVRDETGALVGRSVIHRDVTEQRRMERELMQSEKLSAIGKLSAHIVHEIRNPLSSIRLNLELLRDELDAGSVANLGEGRTLLTAIQTEVDVLTRFTGEYLEFTRPPQLQKGEIDVVEFVKDTVAALREKATHQSTTFHMHANPGIPLVEADPNRLQQALDSIVENALEAMPQGGRLRFEISLDPNSFGSRSRIRVLGYPQHLCPRSLTRSSRPRKAARVWVWPSAARSCASTAETWTSRVRPDRERTFILRLPRRPERRDRVRPPRVSFIPAGRDNQDRLAASAQDVLRHRSGKQLRNPDRPWLARTI
jgi:signal transduction histidine kinase